MDEMPLIYGEPGEVLHFDGSEIRAVVGKDLQVNVQLSNYGTETRIYNYITKLFDAVDAAKKAWNNVCDGAINYADIGDSTKPGDDPIGTNDFPDEDVDPSATGTPSSDNSGTTNTGESYIVATQGGRLNVRSGPGTNNQVQAQLKNETPITVIESDGEWARVKYQTENGEWVEGYVSNKFITKTDTGSSQNADKPSTTGNTNPTTNATSGGEAQDTSNSEIWKVTTQGGRLNVRSGPGTNNQVQAQLKNETPVEFIVKEGDWIKIRYQTENNEWVEGYVSNKYLTKE